MKFNSLLLAHNQIPTFSSTKFQTILRYNRDKELIENHNGLFRPILDELKERHLNKEAYLRHLDGYNTNLSEAPSKILNKNLINYNQNDAPMHHDIIDGLEQWTKVCNDLDIPHRSGALINQEYLSGLNFNPGFYNDEFCSQNNLLFIQTFKNNSQSRAADLDFSYDYQDVTFIDNYLDIVTSFSDSFYVDDLPMFYVLENLSSMNINIVGSIVFVPKILWVVGMLKAGPIALIIVRDYGLHNFITKTISNIKEAGKINSKIYYEYLQNSYYNGKPIVISFSMTSFLSAFNKNTGLNVSNLKDVLIVPRFGGQFTFKNLKTNVSRTTLSISSVWNEISISLSRIWSGKK